MKNKMLKIGTALLSCAILSAVPVSAVTEPYNFTFANTKDVLPVNSGYKNDTEQNYYITIDAGNLSSTNIFGTRIRKAANNDTVSGYKLHKGKKKSEAYAYTSAVNKKTLYLMRGKKDDKSSSKNDLWVEGQVTY